MPVGHFHLTIDEFRDSRFYPSRTRTFRRDEATDRRADKRPLIRAEESRRVSGSGITAPWRTSRESRDDRGRHRGGSQQQTSSVYRGNLHHEYCSSSCIPSKSPSRWTHSDPMPSRQGECCQPLRRWQVSQAQRIRCAWETTSCASAPLSPFYPRTETHDPALAS